MQRNGELEVSYISAAYSFRGICRVVKDDWDLQQAISGDDFVQFLDEDFINCAVETQRQGWVYIDFGEESFGIVRWD